MLSSALAVAACSTLRADPPGSGWQLAFADEFNGNSLDTIKWNYNYPWSQHGLADDSVEQASQVSVANGVMTFTAINQGQWYDNNWRDYTSGAVNTSGLENFTYGYYEASQKMPSQQGTWPAFWMLQNGWPPEIDIEEVPAFGSNPSSYSSGYHYTNSSGSAASAGPGFTSTGIDLSSSYNTYAVNWQPNSLTYYFNGNVVGSISGSQANIAQSAQQYLLLDLGVGGWPGNPPSGTYFPATMETDWVRVWQQPTSTLRTIFTGAGSTNTNWDDPSNWSNGSPDVGAEEAYFGPISGVTSLHVDWNAGSSGGSRAVGEITFQSAVNYTIGYSNKSIMLASTSGTCYINGYYQSGQGIMAIGSRLELYNNTIIDNYLNNPITLQAGVIGTGSLSIEDGGTNINGAATYTGATIVSANGSLVVNGSINGTSNLFLQQGTATIASGGSITTTSYSSIGQSAGNSGTLNITSGSLTVNSDFNVGDVSATGLLYISGTSVVNATTLYVGKYGTSSGTVIQTGGTVAGTGRGNDWRIGGGGSSADSDAVGFYNLSGGSFSAPGNFQVGAYGTGTFIQTNGIVSVAAYLAIGRFPGSVGVYNMSSGNGVLNENASDSILVGEQGTGTFLLGGNSLVNTGQLAIAASDGTAATGTVTQTGGTMNVSAGATIGVSAGTSGSPAVTGIYNLDGGRLYTPSISQNSLSSVTGIFNFSGGTLLATANSTAFMSGLSKAVILGGGAFINTNGFNVSIGQALSSGAGTNGALTKLGSGTLILTNTSSSFTGNINVNTGTLEAAVNNLASSNPVNGILGNATVSRTITLGSGTTLNLAIGNVLAVGTYNPANVTIAVGNGATITNTSGDTNTLGPLNLSGGTITASSGTGNAAYQSYVLNDTVTASGSSKSTITTTGTTNAGYHLGVGTSKNVIFNVDPANTGASLLVSAPLIGGSGTSGGAAGSSLTKTGYGVLTLSSNNSYSGGTTVGSGLLIAGDGLASVGSGNVTVNGGGVIFRSTSVGAVFPLLATGYSNGAWTGAGINSATAAASSNDLLALGEYQPPSSTTFENQSLGTGDVAVKLTYYGDANLDGKVDGSDYTLIDNGLLLGLTGWQNGDFNYDGVVDGSDYTLIDNAFNTQGVQISAEVLNPTAQIAADPAVSSAVPEPASLGLLAIAALGLLGRRNSRRK